MQEVETYWRLALSAGLFASNVYFWGWFGWKCGACDDDSGKKDDRPVDLGSGVVRVLVQRGRRSGEDDCAMKEQHETGNIIDFEDSRNRLVIRRWAAAHGFSVVRGKVT